MFLRQIEVFLAALAKAQTHQAARADGIEGLDQLQAAVRGIAEGVPPRLQTGRGIGENGQIQRRAHQRHAQADEKPFFRGAAQEHHHRAGGADD